MLAPLARSRSESTLSTTSTATSGASETSSSQAVSRRRLSPEQRLTLLKFFERQPHPGREDRVQLSKETGIDLKAVTVWFQNKRQTSKHRLRTVSAQSIPQPQLQPMRSARPPLSSYSAAGNNTMSLDHIAQLKERPYYSTSSTARMLPVPSTPRKTERSAAELWMHMASSPPEPVPSPAADTPRRPRIPRRSVTMQSLEWACAAARKRPAQGNVLEDVDMDTDTEIDEAITPDSSTIMHISPRITLSPMEGGAGLLHKDASSFEARDAADALLMLMGRK